MQRTLRHSIVSSSFTLPLVALAAVTAWLVPAWGEELQMWGLGGMLLLTYLLLELTNRNQLMRIRSRLVSSVFVAWMGASYFLHPISLSYIAPFCLLLVDALLFPCYRKPRPEGRVFHIFALVSIGGYFFPPFLCLAVIVCLSMMFQFRIFTWRSFMAAIFGLALPALFYFLWHVYQGTWFTAFDFLLPYTVFSLPDYATIPVWQMVNFGFVVFFVLLGFLHYYRTNFDDKISVRMSYYAMILTDVAIMAGMVLMPRHFETFQMLLLLNSAPLVAHYFALARGGWLMTLFFFVFFLLIICLGCYNFGLFNTWLPEVARMPDVLSHFSIF